MMKRYLRRLGWMVEKNNVPAKKVLVEFEPVALKWMKSTASAADEYKMVEAMGETFYKLVALGVDLETARALVVEVIETVSRELKEG